jgi:hypothetical protein
MAGLDGNIKIAGHDFPKKQVVIGVGGVGLVAVVYEVRKRKSAAAGSTVTAANDPNSGGIDPATGYTYGSPEDVAALQESGSGYDSASSVSGNGQIIGYDDNGDPVYGSSGTVTANSGPGTYTSNAEWAQAYEAQVGSSGNDSVAAALGKFLTGAQVSPDQVTIIQEAIASQGSPPVSGSSGFPPSIRTTAPATGTTTTGTTGTVAVPRVTGMRVSTAIATLQRAGLAGHPSEPINPKDTYSVNSQTPSAGTKVAKGSTVDLGVKTPA